jgi:hypothetical protein
VYFDVATPGSPSNRLARLYSTAFPDLSALTRYPRRLYSTAILAGYDDDSAGDRARHYLATLQNHLPHPRFVNVHFKCASVRCGPPSRNLRENHLPLDKNNSKILISGGSAGHHALERCLRLDSEISLPLVWR